MPLLPSVPNLVLPVTFLGLMSSFAGANGDPSALCISAARTAAKATGVPYDALLAISVVETGRDLRPWPWTVNLGGEGNWLNSAEDAAQLVSDALNRGATNIDIGCFQLNYRWHAQAFQSVEDMLDPDRNALYAAGYLAQQYARTGDWALAAAAYHSATPEYADQYQTRFEETAAELGGEVLRAAPESPRTNGFPLLIAGVSGLKGSLVPAVSGGVPLLTGP